MDAPPSRRPRRPTVDDLEPVSPGPVERVRGLVGTVAFTVLAGVGLAVGIGVLLVLAAVVAITTLG